MCASCTYFVLLVPNSCFWLSVLFPGDSTEMYSAADAIQTWSVFLFSSQVLSGNSKYLLLHIELYKYLARLSQDTVWKHCPFPYLAVMLCTVVGCLCSARLNLNYRYPSWLPRLSFLQETQLGRYESLSLTCPFLHSCSIHQIIMPCRSIYQFHTPTYFRRTPAAASTKTELTRYNHVGSLRLHFLSNCCLCFHTNGNLGGDFPLDQPPLPRSSRPSQEKGGPLDNP